MNNNYEILDAVHSLLKLSEYISSSEFMVYLRCKKCSNCLVPSCNNCKNCIFKHRRRSCLNRKNCDNLRFCIKKKSKKT